MSISPVSSLQLESVEPVSNTAREAKPLDLDLVGHVDVRVEACLGQAQLSLQSLMSLTAGDIVELNTGLDDPVTLLLNGKAIARAELVAVGDVFGVRVIETL